MYVGMVPHGLLNWDGIFRMMHPTILFTPMHHAPRVMLLIAANEYNTVVYLSGSTSLFSTVPLTMQLYICHSALHLQISFWLGSVTRS